jgi:multiple RNA-binding domain-containing protein 1
MSSRVIVKNLSRNCTAEDLRKAVGDLPVTDARIVSTKTGESRRFGFLGFRSEADAQKALKSLSKAYIGTSKITVELALPVGDEKIKKTKTSVMDLAAVETKWNSNSRWVSLLRIL